MFNLFKRPRKEYVPNSRPGERQTTEEFEDEYTIKQREERLKKDLLSEDTKGFFIDQSGRKTPLGQLDGRRKQLLAQARADIRDEIIHNNELSSLGIEEDEEATTQVSRNEAKKESKKSLRVDPHSIDKFYIGHGRKTVDGERIGSRLGLYRDYNPKLNAGAPGNREERHRQARQNAEKKKWLPEPEN